MVFSAGIILTLGVTHLIYTFWGTKLTPRDPASQISMSQISPVITKETTMWRAWVGFNASHSMGAILFGLIYSFLAIAHSKLLFQSTVPAHCRARDAWWFCCARQVLLVQCSFHRNQYFLGLLR